MRKALPSAVKKALRNLQQLLLRQQVLLLLLKLITLDKNQAPDQKMKNANTLFFQSNKKLNKKGSEGTELLWKTVLLVLGAICLIVLVQFFGKLLNIFKPDREAINAVK